METKTLDYKAVLKKCEELTKDGQKLSVSWDGGNDEGYFALKIDDNEIEDDYGEANSIIDLVDDELDYGSFAGNFSTQGEIIYNRDKKCFEGTDNYSESDSAEYECEIEIRLPAEIWFDRLEINLEVDVFEVEDCEVQLVVLNGPVVDAHKSIEDKIKKGLIDNIRKEVGTIEDFTDLRENFMIERKEFRIEKDELIFSINQFNYSFDNYRDSDILISLTDKIDKQ